MKDLSQAEQLGSGSPVPVPTTEAEQLEFWEK